MNKEVPLNTLVTAQYRADVNAFCKRNGYTRSEWVRNTLTNAMKLEEARNNAINKTIERMNK